MSRAYLFKEFKWKKNFKKEFLNIVMKATPQTNTPAVSAVSFENLIFK